MLKKILLVVAMATLLGQQARAVSDIHDYSSVAASNTDVGGINVGEGMQRASVNNAIRELLAQLKRAIADQGSDISSSGGAPAICATGTSAYVKVTGTTTITSFGTAAAGCSRWVTFTGALQITHNGTSMILPNAANYTTAAGDMIWAVSEGSGNWRVRIFPADGEAVVSPPTTAGVHKLWIPAAAMSSLAGSPAFAFHRTGFTVPFNAWSFDQTTVDCVFFDLGMPSSWDEGTVTFRAVWGAASSSGGVVWELYGVAQSDDDPNSATLSTVVTSTDTLTATDDLDRSPESSELTIDGTPAANDVVTFAVCRAPSNGSDTLAADAQLRGIELYLTTAAATDTP